MDERAITAVFIGNRDCCQVSNRMIEDAVVEAIDSGICVFLNGGQGHFDRTAARAVHNLKERYPFIKSVLLLPYRTFTDYDAALYDEIVFPFEQHIESYCTYMGNIQKRNRMMVKMSSIAICCVSRTTGDAGKALAYARKQGLRIIDLNGAK